LGNEIVEFRPGLKKAVIASSLLALTPFVLVGFTSEAHAVPAMPAPHASTTMTPTGGHWYGGVWFGGPAYYGYGGGYYPPDYSYAPSYGRYYDYGSGDGNYYRAGCGWLRHRAEETGSRHWWRRYRACIDD